MSRKAFNRLMPPAFFRLIAFCKLIAMIRLSSTAFNRLPMARLQVEGHSLCVAIETEDSVGEWKCVCVYVWKC